MNKYFSAILVIIMFFIFSGNVSASSYNPTQNLLSSTQSDYLIDLAYNQIEDFYNSKFVIFQIDNNYYLVSSNDYSVSNSYIDFNNSVIISAVRDGGNYGYSYSYNLYNESSTRVYLNYIVISNIKTNKSIYSDKFNQYNFRKNVLNIFVFILGLCFAIFLTKERRY